MEREGGLLAVTDGVSVVGAGDGDNVVGAGDGDAVVGAGDGDAVVGAGDGDAVVGAGDGDVVVGAGDGDAVVGAGDGGNDSPGATNWYVSGVGPVDPELESMTICTPSTLTVTVHEAEIVWRRLRAAWICDSASLVS